MRLPSLLLLPLLSALSHAALLTISIAPSPPLPNPATLPSTTHALLLGAAGIQYDVPLRRDNTFVFPDLADASYLLTLHSRDYFFPPLRVDVEGGGGGAKEQNISVWQTFRGNEWGNKGPSLGTWMGELRVEVRPIGLKDFYQPRGGFNVFGFLKSPMILMGLVSVAMIVGLPYIMDSMDPEMKAEFEEMQKKGPMSGPEGAANQLQNFDLAGWMAGKGQASGGGGGGGGGGGKRK